MTKKKRRGGLILTIAIVGIAAGIYGAGPGGWFANVEETALEGVPVRRGPLRISEVVRGNLKAKDSITLKSEIEGRCTILYLIEEGTTVHAGDLIAELDVTELADDRVAQEISVQNAQAAFTKAREQFDIQEIQNESDIASAEMKVTFAAIDKEKYIDGEWPQELKMADEAILIAEEKLNQADDQLVWTKELHEKGFVQRTELERDELAKQVAEIALEQAKRDKELLTKYTNPRRVAELDADIAEMGRDLKRVKKQASAMLADFFAAKETTAAKLELETQKLDKIEDQVAKARIVAPDTGIVVYGRSKSGRSYMGGGEPVSEGGEVSERSVIATLPRPGGMIVEASLHETVLKRVAVGQPCTIIVDAMSSQSFDGRVEFVAVLPDANSWYANPNQRLYRSEISITNASQEMRPGMSCSVEILSDYLEDTLFVPVQSVFVDAGKTICFVKTDSGVEPRTVVVGTDNSKWVSIESGLEENELVLMSSPANFTPSAAPDKGPGGGAHPMGAGGEVGAGSTAGGSGAPSEEMRAKMRAAMQGGGSEMRGGRPGGDRNARRGGGESGGGGGERGKRPAGDGGQSHAKETGETPAATKGSSEDSE